MTPTPTDDERQRAREIVFDIDADWSWDYQKTGVAANLAQNDVTNAIASALAASREAATPKWRPISEAPKDGTPIFLQLKNPIPRDLERDRDWDGVLFLARHPGIAPDGFDVGWNFAARVGVGGFPDEWIAGWLPREALPSPPEREP